MAKGEKKEQPARQRKAPRAIRLTADKVVRERPNVVIGRAGQELGVPADVSREKAAWLLKHGFAEAVEG